MTTLSYSTNSVSLLLKRRDIQRQYITLKRRSSALNRANGIRLPGLQYGPTWGMLVVNLGTNKPLSPPPPPLTRDVYCRDLCDGRQIKQAHAAFAMAVKLNQRDAGLCTSFALVCMILGDINSAITALHEVPPLAAFCVRWKNSWSRRSRSPPQIKSQMN